MSTPNGSTHIKFMTPISIFCRASLIEQIRQSRAERSLHESNTQENVKKIQEIRDEQQEIEKQKQRVKQVRNF